MDAGSMDAGSSAAVIRGAREWLASQDLDARNSLESRERDARNIIFSDAQDAWDMMAAQAQQVRDQIQCQDLAGDEARQRRVIESQAFAEAQGAVDSLKQDIAALQQRKKPLLPGWQQAATPDGRVYYYLKGKPSTWTRPERTMFSLPSGWTEHFDPGHNRSFFVGPDKCSKWDPPEEAGRCQCFVDSLKRKGWEEDPQHGKLILQRMDRPGEHYEIKPADLFPPGRPERVTYHCFQEGYGETGCYTVSRDVIDVQLTAAATSARVMPVKKEGEQITPAAKPAAAATTLAVPAAKTPAAKPAAAATTPAVLLPADMSAAQVAMCDQLVAAGWQLEDDAIADVSNIFLKCNSKYIWLPRDLNAQDQQVTVRMLKGHSSHGYPKLGTISLADAIAKKLPSGK